MAQQQQGRQEEALWLVSKPDLDDKSGTEGWLLKLGATGIVLTPPENADFKECTQHNPSRCQVTAYEKGSKELWREKNPTYRELGRHSEREEQDGSHTHWESSYRKVSHLLKVSWIQAYWTASCSLWHWYWRVGPFTKQVIHLKCTIKVWGLEGLYYCHCKLLQKASVEKMLA